jgi:hypothetical protein
VFKNTSLMKSDKKSKITPQELQHERAYKIDRVDACLG